MTADPRDTVSDLTEITDEELIQMVAYVIRAIGWGALAGGVSHKIRGTYREGLTHCKFAADEECDPPTNPYHDMIY